MPALPFAKEEYSARLSKVRSRMATRGLHGLIVTDIPNQHYLTGYDGWSFYTPQIVAVPLEEGEPYWIGRAMDALGGRLTAHMAPEYVVGFPEDHVHRPDIHPMDWIADYLKSLGWDGKRIGYESDSFYFSPRAFACLEKGMPNAEFVDADLMINWIRSVKSEAELKYMRMAAKLVGNVQTRAREVIRPGVRQCDAIGEIYKVQMSGHPDISGDITSLCPLIMAGETASAPHLMWNEDKFEIGQTCALEFAAAVRHYNAGLARTVHLGSPPTALMETAKAVEEGLEAVLHMMKAGVTGGEVEAAWRGVISCYGLEKKSRIGYGIGLGYPPDWGERTISLRADEATVLKPDNTVHVMLGMWMDGWGMEMSETVLVSDTGNECLTNFPRGVHVID
jgi:ectoine hydrolase